MAKKPDIQETRADGTQIIKPDYSLKEKLGDLDINKVLSSEKVQQAEEIIEERKEDFSKEVAEDILELEKIYEKALKKPADYKVHVGKMMNVTLNIKSSSGIFGYPLATRFAQSLFSFLSVVKNLDEVSARMMDAHIKALKMIYRDNIQGDGGDAGKELLRELQSYTDHYRDHH